MKPLQPITSKLRELSTILEVTADMLDAESYRQHNMELANESLKMASIELNAVYYNLNDLLTNLKFKR